MKKTKYGIVALPLIAGIMLAACWNTTDEDGGGLAPPSMVNAEGTSPTSITLTWTAVSGAVKYKIYTAVAATSGNYQYVDETELNTYVVSDLISGSTHYYKVSSVDIDGMEGPLSAYTAATTLIVTYTVTFNANNGSGDPPPAQTVNAGSGITLPGGNGLSFSGFVFTGWNTHSAGSGTPYSAGSSYTVTGDITLYATWSDPNVSYTVTFSANGGSGTPPAAVSGTAGYQFSLPGAGSLTRNGYTFGGWSTSPTTGLGTPYSAGSSYTVAGNVTLYAKWDSSGPPPTPGSDNVPGNTISDKLIWLANNAQSDGVYTIMLSSDQSLSPQTLSYTGENNITINLRGSGSNRTISLSSTSGPMFTIANGVTLILHNNVTLKGQVNIDHALVRINAFGTLIMNEGSAITDNKGNGNYTGFLAGGGGIYIAENGNFTMNGGTISGNRANRASRGGGVHMEGGIFTMNNGTISNNTVGYSTACGGGVNVRGGTFTMKGGRIFGNATTGDWRNGSSYKGSYGGGVYVGDNGTFNMEGGTISQNIANSDRDSDTNYYGGGVYVSGIFNKTGGTIYGYSASDANSNIVSSGAVSYRGHAVYAAYQATTNFKGKDTTAGPGENMAFNGESGEFSGSWDF